MASTNGTNTFHIRKSVLYGGASNLAFAISVFVAWVCGIRVCVDQEARMFIGLCGPILWGSLLLASTAMLIDYWRYRLTIDKGRIVLRGIFRHKEVDLVDVMEARWLVPKGRLRLRTPFENLTIVFDNFESRQRLWLIRFFRQHTPEPAQKDWELFCHGVALPLRDPKPNAPRSPGPDEYLYTRRHWDWLCVCMFAVVAVVCGIIAIWSFEPPLVVGVFATAVLAWLWRFRISKHGEVHKRPSVDNRGFLRFIFVSMGVATGLHLTLAQILPGQAAALMCINLLLCLGLFVWRFQQFLTKERQREWNAAVKSSWRWEKDDAVPADPHSRPDMVAHASSKRAEKSLA